MFVFIQHGNHPSSCMQIGFITSATSEVHSSLNCKGITAIEDAKQHCHRLEVHKKSSSIQTQIALLGMQSVEDGTLGWNYENLKTTQRKCI